MKKLLTEWRKYLKEIDYDVEASVERDADFGKHADIKMEIENALDDAGQDWVLDMDDWPAETGRTMEEFQEVIQQMEASLQNNLGVSIKGLLAGELNEEAISRLNEKPAKGKAKQKVTASGKKVSYGQAGKAKGGGPRVKPGTSKGDSYCARSMGIKRGLSKKKQNDPNTPNNLSRKRWKCSGEKSTK